MNLRSGVKIYDNDWFIRQRMEPEQLADLLASWNITYVIAQSKYLPMQDSAVASRVSAADAARHQLLDDVVVRKALAERGIAYFAVLNICFDPDFTEAHPQVLPIDQFGELETRQDWYIGIPPDRTSNIDHKIGMLERGVAALSPDVVHLGFIRWPGFWETWLPGDTRASKPEYCFSRETLIRFCADAGISLPLDRPVEAAGEIARRYRGEWTRFKCQQTLAAIRRMRRAVTALKPDIEISINTLPFFADDFEGAVTEVFGQDVGLLAECVDIFEVMAYHQIMRQPATWPAAVAADIRQRSGARALCTVQSDALYLEGMHAGRGRSERIDAVEFDRMLTALEPTAVDGLCVFTLAGLLGLRGTADGDAIIDRLRRFRM